MHAVKDIAVVMGVSNSAAELYLLLVKNGALTRGQIIRMTGRTEARYQKIKQELLMKHFVAVTHNEQHEEFLEAVSPLQLREKLERDAVILQRLKQIVEPRTVRNGTLDLIRYSGLEGIRKTFIEVLEEAIKTGEDILAFESGVYAGELGQGFLSDYTSRRIEHNINAYVITPVTPLDREYKEKYEGKHTFIKMTDKVDIKGNINIVSNLVMTFTLDPFQGTLRRNLAEATTLKSVFRTLWECL